MGTEEATLDTTGTPNGTLSESPSGLESKIIRQIEYYFGDYNLTKDKFLREQIKLDDGWIPLETMIKFNRLKSLSTEFDVILSAVKKSTAQLLQVSEDGRKIRRNPEKPLPENTAAHIGEVAVRTVHVKSFPLNTTLDNLLDFFKDKGNVENIQMRRRFNSRQFKGSVYATFATKEEAEKFLKVEDLKFKTNPLIVESKEAHTERKIAEHLERKEKRNKEKEAKLAKKEVEEKEKADEVSFDETNIMKGALLKITGLGQNTSWEDIKGVFNCHSRVAFVDYSRGLPEACVRFEDEGGAKVALEKALSQEADGKIIIRDITVVTEVLEGEDEVEYWKKVYRMKEQRRQRQHNKFQRGKGGRGRGRGGRQGNFGDRKRKESDGPKAPTEQHEDDHVQERVKPEPASVDTEPKEIKTEPSEDETVCKKAKVDEASNSVSTVQKTKPDDDLVNPQPTKKIKIEETHENPPVKTDGDGENSVGDESSQ